jgi:hypothetical protein
MAEVNIEVFTQNDIATLKRRQTGQAPRSATYIVPLTWTLAAAFGVAFWLLLLSYGIPIVAKIEKSAVTIKHLVADRSPNTEAAEW